ncbi:restriction endonuclease subunit S [Aerococcaceae bacterium NML201209]|nr:restriction endonuclease subunit S [Aerococcaceae bacterium NML201209]
MNKIEELIQQLCPNGVEYKELGEVCMVNKGQQLNKTLLTNDGIYPAYNGGQSFSGRTNNYNVSENTTIISQGGASAGYVNFIETKFWANAHCYYLTPNENQIDNRYLYHLVKMNQRKMMEAQHGSGIPALKLSIITGMKLPVPPLEIQKEIVKILDDFTKYVTELTSELTFRKQQYSYYRDKLLSFEDSDVKVEWKTLDDMFEIIAGGDVPKDAFSEYKTSDYSIPILSNGIGENAIYGWTNIAKIEKPSLTISARGTIGWTSFQDKPFVPIVRLLVLTPKSNINLKYAYYFMKSIECNYDIPQSGIPQLTKPMIRNKLIPIPPLHIQEKIVEVLDNFDKVCNDLNIGLPKEIEQRQQQYEYYRDLLLTFDVNNGSLPACLPA